MIQSNEDAVIVEFKYKESGTKCEGVKLLHCECGEELKCLRSERGIERAEIVKIIRRK
jgi:predicted peroxiredoxin